MNFFLTSASISFLQSFSLPQLQRPDQEPQLIKTSIQFTVDLNPDEVDFETLSEDVVDDRKSGGLGSLPFGPLEFDSL